MSRSVHHAVEQIARDLQTCGVRQGGMVLVHSSLSSMGYVPGGAASVVQGFLEALGPEGTLLMPALSFDYVRPDRPFFDIRRTPSCVGMITECFRQWPGVKRSLQPTHSVCGLGPGAETLLSEHQLDDTPCGRHSPYRRLRSGGGQLVFLGCGTRCNTSMHAVEELVRPPYLFSRKVEYHVTREDGSSKAMFCWRHGFSGWRQRYDRLNALLSEDELYTGNVMAATVHVMECRAVWRRALTMLKDSTFFFVERHV